jgi:hypothetical protein
MRKTLIGGALALIAAVIWLGASAPQRTVGDSMKPPAGPTPGDGQAPDAAASPAVSAKAAPAHPANWAAEVPPAKGKARNGFLKYPSRAKAVEGGIDSLDGAVRTYDISKSVYTQGADSVLSLSVETGKVRAYLQYFPDDGSFFRHQDGYVFAEAAPGAPGAVEGLLAWGGGSGDNETYAVTFESLEGQATGIRYRITPRK